MAGIVESILTRDVDRVSRLLPNGSEFKPEKILPCDASYDTMADVPPEILADRRYAKFPEYSIQGTVDAVGKEFGGIDIIVHSIAFSREITKTHTQTSRKGYLEAIGISAYSLTSLCRAAEPYMANRPGGGASVVGLTYVGGDRVVPYYGGGMSTAKAALQIDCKQLASNLGPKNIRVNLISAGPYASRAAPQYQTRRVRKNRSSTRRASRRYRGPSSLRRLPTPPCFLVSDLASAITGHILYVDCGYNVMGI